MLGGYNINVVTSGLPQKVASGFDKVFKEFTGASYTPIAYLGSQLVNGTNHAILCEQNLITAKDVRGIAVVVLNEKPNDARGESLELYEIKPCFSDKGQKLGGINIAPSTKIPEDAMNLFNKRFGTEGYLRDSNTPFAVLASQIVNGVVYFYAVESTMVISSTGNDGMVFGSGANKSIIIIKLFSNYNEIQTVTILEGAGNEEENEVPQDGVLSHVVVNNQKNLVKYAFNW